MKTSSNGQRAKRDQVGVDRGLSDRRQRRRSQASTEYARPHGASAKNSIACSSGIVECETLPKQLRNASWRSWSTNAPSRAKLVRKPAAAAYRHAFDAH